jgi:hypothetical protein
VSANIPNATSIGSGAFNGCYKLASVNMPNLITISGMYAFKDCKELTSVDLSNVTKIDNGTFEGCTKLASVRLPATLPRLVIQMHSRMPRVNSTFQEARFQCINRHRGGRQWRAQLL